MSDVTSVAASGGATPATAASTSKPTATTKSSTFKEKLEKVAGHDYAKIADGDRKGLYVNQSANARKGEAFRLVERGGHEFHVYGDAKDRKVFEVPAAKKTT